MDFIGGAGSGSATGTGFGLDGAADSGGAGSVEGASAGANHENGPILFTEPNRTSAIDDINSYVLYVLIASIFVIFIIIFPGVRKKRFPTFICITVSLLVASIILIGSFGTSWHVGKAPISAPYKAFSKDRIQGELSVRMGLQSVNVTLRAHKYYILHETHGPMIMENMQDDSSSAQNNHQSSPAADLQAQAPIGLSSNPPTVHSSLSADDGVAPEDRDSNFAEELLRGRSTDGLIIETELEADEVFGSGSSSVPASKVTRRARSSLPTNPKSHSSFTVPKSATTSNHSTATTRSSPTNPRAAARTSPARRWNTSIIDGKEYTVKLANVDINYNERFYWIDPSQMAQEHHKALERGLPYPILTVVEYLSQDEAGFSWSRRYRAAGYYTSIMLRLDMSACALMFVLHCAAPKYAIYVMQILGCMLLVTNLTYWALVPRGDTGLVIPFEGQDLSLALGWNFWLVFIGGCLSLIVGTVFVIIDKLFPNFIFTTILDVDYDSRFRRKQKDSSGDALGAKYRRNAFSSNSPIMHERPMKPPFLTSLGNGDSSSSSSSKSQQKQQVDRYFNKNNHHNQQQHHHHHRHSAIGDNLLLAKKATDQQLAAIEAAPNSHNPNTTKSPGKQSMEEREDDEEVGQENIRL